MLWIFYNMVDHTYEPYLENYHFLLSFVMHGSPICSYEIDICTKATYIYVFLTQTHIIEGLHEQVCAWAQTWAKLKQVQAQK